MTDLVDTDFVKPSDERPRRQDPEYEDYDTDFCLESWKLLAAPVVRALSSAGVLRLEDGE